MSGLVFGPYPSGCDGYSAHDELLDIGLGSAVGAEIASAAREDKITWSAWRIK